MACGPDTSSEIVGREAGARTCQHVRPGCLAMLECRFNKTTHHPKSWAMEVLVIIALVCVIYEKGMRSYGFATHVWETGG